MGFRKHIMKLHNTVEINGKLYDATTGLPVGKEKSSPQVSKPSVAKNIKRPGKSIDGFTAQSKSTAMSMKKPKSASPHNPSKIVTVASRNNSSTQNGGSTPASKPKAAHTPAQSIKMHTKRSTTLHRSAVKKPILTSEKKVSDKVNPKPSTHERFSHMQQVEKSSAISRFHQSNPKNIAKPASINTAARDLSVKKSAPQPKSAEISTKETLIKRGLAHAALAHETSASSKTSKKRSTKKHAFHITRYASTALVALLLVGYVAYLNVPSISMKVAAHRAGFAATLPGYKPSGYSFSGPISYSPGQVTINFNSNTDNRSFSLKQQPSTWDSSALLENYVTKQSPNYLTYQDQGLTIYIYNGSSASWVNGGKLYQIEGKNSQLDTEQLLNLATNI